MAPHKGKSKYKFEVRWSSGKYYSCNIVDENKYFAPGSNYNIEGTEEDGRIWHANVPIGNLRLVGSAANHVELLDALTATIAKKAVEAEKNPTSTRGRKTRDGKKVSRKTTTSEVD